MSDIFKMLVALTYNVKKEEEKVRKIDTSISKYINESILINYPERIDDTYAEWDSMETIEAIKNALEEYNNNVVLIEADENAYIKIRNTKPNIVFNVAEGFYGASRESQIPSILEMLNIPYTGSDSITIGICHDKSRCKEILSYYRIPNPDFLIVNGKFENQVKKFPKFVKPLHEGSSKGIYNSSVVNNEIELKREVERIKEIYKQPALIEDFIKGKEFTVAMLGNGENVKVLPIIEINLDEVPSDFNKIYSYEVKWFFDTRENKLDIFKCPAEVDDVTYKAIEKVAIETFQKLRLRDWARIDIRLDVNNIPNVIEVNPLPGILPDPEDNSCFPKAARVAGMNYNQMINAVLEEAKKRYNLI
ncbi:MAG: ATP-grasp domain-containing protein [Ignavibacteria bacterium]|nr:ATP-grasp domain-containing protein [Ignavibacteria bacterium]